MVETTTPTLFFSSYANDEKSSFGREHRIDINNRREKINCSVVVEETKKQKKNRSDDNWNSTMNGLKAFLAVVDACIKCFFLFGHCKTIHSFHPSNKWKKSEFYFCSINERLKRNCWKYVDLNWNGYVDLISNFLLFNWFSFSSLCFYICQRRKKHQTIFHW